MSDGFAHIPDVGAVKVDTEELTVGGNTVERQRMEIAGAAAAEVARVQNSAPAGTEQALVVRNIPSGTQTVSGTVAVSGTVPVSGPLTDAQLRASAVPVDASGVTQPISAAALPLPSGASTEATLALIKAKTDNIDVALSTRTKPADTQTVSGTVAVSGSVAVTGPLTDTQLRASAVPISAASLPLPTSAAQEHATAASPHSVELSDGSAFYTGTKTGQLPTALDGSGYLKTHEQGTANVSVQNASLAITAAALPLPSNAAQETGGNLATIAGKDFATSAKQDTGNTSLSTIAAKDFSTSAKQDTGNTSLATIAGKDFATSAKQDTGNTSLSTISTAQTSGSQKTQIVDASGNVIAATSNRLQVDPSGVTSPVSVASLPLPSGAALDATLTGGTQKTKIVDADGDVAVITATGNLQVEESNASVMRGLMAAQLVIQRNQLLLLSAQSGQAVFLPNDVFLPGGF